MARKPSYGMLGKKWSAARRAHHDATVPGLPDRIMDRIEYDTAGGCWLWTGAMVLSTGYGTIGYRGRSHGAHRASWMAFRGPIPPSLVICHKCDVPSCVNPEHLFLGTVADNANDMIQKGRGHGMRGDTHPGAKLSSRDIPLVLQRLAAGEGCKEIGASYGLTDCTVNAIRRGISWKSVTAELVVAPIFSAWTAREGLTIRHFDEPSEARAA